MAQPQLSVRSARARDLAHRLAASERRSVAQVVEQALELYAKAGTPKRESAAEFYERLARDASTDIDLEAIIQEHRVPHIAPKL